MSQLEDISELFAAERAEQPPTASSVNGWHDLSTALKAEVAALPVAHGPLKLGLSVAAKWGVGSGIAALAVAASSAGLGRLPPDPTGHPALVAAIASAPARHLGPAPLSGSAAPAAPPSSVAVTPEPAPSGGTRPSTFADELRLIKLAKQEQDAGRYHLAEVWLDQHEQLYPQGVFSTERDAIRALLTCQQSAAGGRERARQFMARNPTSPLLDRISRACWPTGEPAPARTPESTSTSVSPTPVGSTSFPNLENDK
jgi:hypothetical protein